MKELKGDIEWETREYGSEYEPEVHRFDESGHPIDYIAWDTSNSRIVSGPYGSNNFPGVRFPDRAAARAYWSARAVIVEEYRAPGRWILRLKGRA
jgi:hypothetical protein